MSLESIIAGTIERIVAKTSAMVVTEGVVEAVDRDKKTCDVSRDNMPELFSVRLNAVVSAAGTLTIYPAKGSRVLCVIIENNPTDAYVLTCTDVEDVVFNEGENGGLLRVEAVAAQLSEVKDDLNALKNVFKTWVTAPGDGGAALKAAAATWAGQGLPDVDVDLLQNKKFKH